MTKEKVSEGLFKLARDIRLGDYRGSPSSALERWAKQAMRLESRLERAESVCFHTLNFQEELRGTIGTVLQSSLRQWQESRHEFEQE